MPTDYPPLGVTPDRVLTNDAARARGYDTAFWLQVPAYWEQNHDPDDPEANVKVRSAPPPPVTDDDDAAEYPDPIIVWPAGDHDGETLVCGWAGDALWSAVYTARGECLGRAAMVIDVLPPP